MDLVHSKPHPPIAWRRGRDGRAAECEALEKPSGETLRGFESHSLRWQTWLTATVPFTQGVRHEQDFPKTAAKQYATLDLLTGRCRCAAVSPSPARFSPRPQPRCSPRSSPLSRRTPSPLCSLPI